MEEISSFREKCGIVRVHLKDPFSLLLAKILGITDMFAIGIYYVDEALVRTILYYELTGQVVNWILTFNTLLESPSVQSIHIMKFPPYRQYPYFCRNLKQSILNVNGISLIDDFFLYKQIWLQEPFTNTGYKLVNLICNSAMGLVGHVSETTLTFNVNDIDARLFIPVHDDGRSNDKTVYRQELDFILHHTRQEFASLAASFIDLYLYSARFRQRVLTYKGEDFLASLTKLLNTGEIEQTIFVSSDLPPSALGTPLKDKALLKNGYIRVKPYPNLGQRLRNFTEKILKTLHQGVPVPIDLQELLIISDLLNGDQQAVSCQEDVCYNRETYELFRFSEETYTKTNLLYQNKTYPGILQTNFLGETEELISENRRTLILTDYGTEEDLKKLTRQEVSDTLVYLNLIGKLPRLQEKLRLELANRDVNRTSA